MGTGGWARRVGSGEFVQEPVRWRTEALLVFLPVNRIGLVSLLPGEDSMSVARRRPPIATARLASRTLMSSTV